MKQPNYYRQILKALDRLHKAHPTYNMGRHLATALDESNLWGLDDREMLYAIQKYEIELNIDHAHTDEIEEIIKDGMNLERTLFEEEED